MTRPARRGRSRPGCRGTRAARPASPAAAGSSSPPRRRRAEPAAARRAAAPGARRVPVPRSRCGLAHQRLDRLQKLALLVGLAEVLVDAELDGARAVLLA